ncbi:MAG: hypothetical protein ACC682_01755 [Gemmatimonadota bacterium]
MKHIMIRSTLLSTGLLVWGCAGADNPTALADLEPVAEFEIDVAQVETMHEIEITARVREGGAPMSLIDAQFEVHAPTGPTRVVSLEGNERGYSAQVRFYEVGEHHISLLGQPERHQLMRELGEYEIEVERQQLIHQNYRFELSVSPAPIVLGVPARIMVHGWEIQPDGAPGPRAVGLELQATLHTPDGIEVPVDLTEVTQGEYQVEVSLLTPGSYELSVELGGESAPAALIADPDGHGSGMEFEIFVPSPANGGEPSAEDKGGNGH